MYRIGMFSQIGRVTIKTLRFYDEIGLLRPAFTDPDTGYRYYTTAQIERLHQIVALKQIGFAIAEIAAILDGRREEDMLQQRRLEIENQLADSQERLSRINHYISLQKEGYAMNYQAVVKNIPACTVFSKRLRIPDYAALMTEVPKTGAEVSAANPGLTCAEPEYCFNIYHDGEYREKNIDVEICQAVTSRGQDVGGIVFKDMPAVTVVSTMHKGTYDNLGQAYGFLFQWIEENNYQTADLPRESYIDGIWNKQDVADWLTEVQIPIRKE